MGENEKFVVIYQDDIVGVGSRSYRKSYCFGTSKSKVIVPEWLRGESSTTALKEVAKTRGLSYPHKGKGGMRPRH